jgi:hypothetical protein
VINQTDPDILAIQEMGEAVYLQELWGDLNRTKGTEFNYSAWLPGTGGGREKGILALAFEDSFYPRSDAPKDLSFKYFEGRRSPSRGLLEVEFKSGDTKWSLFNLHLKSKWTERPDDPEAAIRREKEARAIRDYIRTKFPPYTDPSLSGSRRF